MKLCTKTLAALLFVITVTAALSAPVSAGFSLPATRTVNAKSAVLVYLGANPSEDVLLYEKEKDEKRSPGAMIRIMVGATAMKIISEQGIDMDTRTGAFTAQCNNDISGTGLAIVNMKIGETWTIRDLLSMSMIHTAADACVTLAHALSGSQGAFVGEMNKLAEELGCAGTSFANVTGLDSLGQYITASDAAKIMRYAMDFGQLQDMMMRESYTGKDVNSGASRTYLNTNEMVRKGSARYNATVQFGKTGVSGAGGYCLTTVAQSGGYRYLTVVLGCPEKDADDRTGVHYTDTSTLLSWAFNGFSYRSLVGKNEPKGNLKVDLAWDRDSVQLVPENGISAIVPNELDISSVQSRIIIDPDTVDAPVVKGQVYGKLQLIIGVDQVIGEDNLIAGESVARSDLLVVWRKAMLVLKSPWLYAGIGTLVLLILMYVVLNVVHNRRRRRSGTRMKQKRRYK